MTLDLTSPLLTTSHLPCPLPVTKQYPSILKWLDGNVEDLEPQEFKNSLTTEINEYISATSPQGDHNDSSGSEMKLQVVERLLHLYKLGAQYHSFVVGFVPVFLMNEYLNPITNRYRSKIPGLDKFDSPESGKDDPNPCRVFLIGAYNLSISCGYLNKTVDLPTISRQMPTGCSNLTEGSAYTQTMSEPKRNVSALIFNEYKSLQKRDRLWHAGRRFVPLTGLNTAAERDIAAQGLLSVFNDLLDAMSSQSLLWLCILAERLAGYGRFFWRDYRSHQRRITYSSSVTMQILNILQHIMYTKNPLSPQARSALDIIHETAQTDMCTKTVLVSTSVKRLMLRQTDEDILSPAFDICRQSTRNLFKYLPYSCGTARSNVNCDLPTQTMSFTRGTTSNSTTVLQNTVAAAESTEIDQRRLLRTDFATVVRLATINNVKELPPCVEDELAAPTANNTAGSRFIMVERDCEAVSFRSTNMVGEGIEGRGVTTSDSGSLKSDKKRWKVVRSLKKLVTPRKIVELKGSLDSVPADAQHELNLNCQGPAVT